MVEEPVQGAIDEDGTEVDRDVQRLLGRGQIRSGGAAERPYEITTTKPDGREWTARPPFGRDHLDRGGAVVDDDEVGGRSSPHAPVGPLLDTHGVCTVPERATTPRWMASPALRAALAVELESLLEVALVGLPPVPASPGDDGAGAAVTLRWDTIGGR